jgi:hypothetical protein
MVNDSNCRLPICVVSGHVNATWIGDEAVVCV